MNNIILNTGSIVKCSCSEVAATSGAIKEELELSKFSEEATYVYVSDIDSVYTMRAYYTSLYCVVRVCVVSTSTEILKLPTKYPAMRPME